LGVGSLRHPLLPRKRTKTPHNMNASRVCSVDVQDLFQHPFYFSDHVTTPEANSGTHIKEFRPDRNELTSVERRFIDGCGVCQ
jgi:hypothetical protein